MEGIKKVNWYTYIGTVSASHWYYGSINRDYMIDFSIYDDDNNIDREQDILKKIIENDVDFKYINWDEVTLTIDYVIDGKIYTKITKYEY